MYRFLLTPRWLAFHLLVIVTIVVMVNLGFWQLRRLDERQAFNDEVRAATEMPPEPIGDLVILSRMSTGIEWRSIVVTGSYQPDLQFVVVNRSQGGVAGDLVVTPMLLEDGRTLLVQRGFVPLGQTAAPAPAGEVEIVGRLREMEQRRRGQLTDELSDELTEVQRIDVRVEPYVAPGDHGIVPMWVELISSDPAETGPFPQPVSLPELTDGPHLSYAVQWFIFAAAVGVGWVLAVRKSINDRRTGSPPAGDASPMEAVAPQPTSS